MNIKKIFEIIILLGTLFSIIWFTIKWWWFLPVLIVTSFTIQVVDKVIKIKNDVGKDSSNSDGDTK